MLLPYLIILPFFSGIICWKLKIIKKKLSLLIIVITLLLVLIITIAIYLQLNIIQNNNIDKWIYIFSISWIKTFNINITLAVDKLSLIMIILTTILGLITIIVSWNIKLHNQKTYYFYLMWLFSSNICVFMATDLFLFFFSWEMMIIPMYFLILKWGINTKHTNYNIKKAALKFFIYTQISGLIILISILGLAFNYYTINGTWTFAYDDFLNIKIPLTMQYILLSGFFIAFAIKIPLVPFHGWMVKVQEHSPITGSVDILGIMLKTAIYGIIRFTIPLFPDASIIFTPIINFLGILTIYYGGLLAFQQTNIKKLISYSIISHMGFIVIGIYSTSIIAYQGVILQIITTTISGSALIIISNQLYIKIKSYNIYLINNINKQIFWLPGFLLFFSFANLGIPGTGNFIGEFLIFISIFNKSKIIGSLLVLSIIITTIYTLRMIHLIYFDHNKQKIKQTIEEMKFHEIIILLLLAFLIIIIGFYPQFLLNATKNIFELILNNYI